MTLKTLPLMIAAAAIVTISSCKKEEDPKPTKSKTEYLTQSKWVLKARTSNTAIDYDQDGTSSTDVFAQMDACDKDDFVKFDANKTVVLDEGATKCNSGDPQSTTYQWAWNANENKIFLQVAGVNVEEWALVTLDDNTLKVTFTYDDGGTTYTFTDTFSH